MPNSPQPNSVQFCILAWKEDSAALLADHEFRRIAYLSVTIRREKVYNGAVNSDHAEIIIRRQKESSAAIVKLDIYPSAYWSEEGGIRRLAKQSDSYRSKVWR